MQLIRGLHNLKLQLINGCVATIGNYDGVHLGHQKILNIVKKKSIELNLPALVVVFEPQPEEFFVGKKMLRLTSLQEKIIWLEKYGIDQVVLLTFNAHLASVTAMQFITEILVKKLHVKHLVVGDDFTFGHNRVGNFDLLETVASQFGFQVTQIDPFKIDGVRVSSSLIRTALLQSNLDLAAKFLGRPYEICGKVVRGDRRGHELGFPTANIRLGHYGSPLTGVYLVKVCNLMSRSFFGVANVGFRPTFLSKHKLLEVNIFDFSDEIYGFSIKVCFLKKIRDEKKFNSLMALKAQIEKDVILAQQLLNKNSELKEL